MPAARDEKSTTPAVRSSPVLRRPGSRVPGWRTALGRGLGVVGLAGYNWWILVAAGGTLIESPNELFSDLEAVGRPYAALLSRVDAVSGAAILVALLLVGRPGAPGRHRRGWWLLLVFAGAAMVGGLFPYLCPEGLSAACRSAEWGLALSWRHYLHMISGIVEFGTASAAAVLAWRRTRGRSGAVPLVARVVVTVLVVGYPLLAVTYLSGQLGAFVEPAFFLAFSAVVAAELFAER